MRLQCHAEIHYSGAAGLPVSRRQNRFAYLSIQRQTGIYRLPANNRRGGA